LLLMVVNPIRGSEKLRMSSPISLSGGGRFHLRGPYVPLFLQYLSALPMALKKHVQISLTCYTR
jgi:hypothetical protein